MFIIPSLETRVLNWVGDKGLIKTSASCMEDLTGRSLRRPFSDFSRTIWQSNSICFVRSWKTWLEAIWIADRLSQNRLAGWVNGMRNSWRRYVSHWSSHVVVAKARYSASDELREIVDCFLERYDMRELPRKLYCTSKAYINNWIGFLCV